MIKLYKVGGAVRDQILGLKSKDIDYAVEASSYEEMVSWIKANGKIYLEKPEYFTIRGRIGDVDADFVLCRKEGAYKDGRRPDTVEVGDIYDDLSRRDFTVNAIAETEEGILIDPYNGIADIDRKILRCVGVTKDRFQEDGLRMLRAIRFSITKEFGMSTSIKTCLKDTDFITQNMKGVSTDRIRDEINRCFAFDTLLTFSYMQEYASLFNYIFYSTDIKMKMTSEAM
jgi:tRNA nucleotidyltransferase (CCA-adding enzyme)